MRYRAVDLGLGGDYMFWVHRNLLIISFLLVFGSFVAVGQQTPKSIHTLPVDPAAPLPETQAPNPGTPAAPESPMPVPGNGAPGAPTVPATAQNPVAAEEPVTKLEFPNSDVKEVLNFYERLTGARMVYDNTVIGTVNIVISSPVSQREAIQIIETNLLLNGYSLIPAPGNIIKVIGLSKNPRTTGVPIFSDASMIPESDRVITFLFKLKYSDPTEMVQMLQSGYIAPSLYTAVTALPKSQSIMVTESTPVIRGLLKIIQQIDVPPAEVVSEFIPLERADVKDVLEKLEKLFEKPQSQGGAGASVRTIAPPPNNPAEAPAPAAGGNSVEIQGGSSLSEDAVIVGKIKLTADIRTNRIHVITRPINLAFVRQLIRDFDSNVPFAEPAKRVLRFVPASEMLDIVVKAISEPGVKAEEGGGGGGSKAAKSSSQSQSNSYGGGSSGGMGGMSAGSGIGGEDLEAASVDTTPKAVTVGNTKIIADPRENTIIVLGNKEVQSKVFALIDQIDVRAPQVMLNTVIGELSVNETTSIGIDYLIHSGGLLSGGSNSSTLPTGTGSIVGNTNGFGANSLVSSLASALGGGSGLTAVLGLGNSLDVVVQALQATGRFKVIQRPMIFTSNNKKAIIASGESISVTTQQLSNVGNSGVLAANNTAAVSSASQYVPVELKLEVVPLINSDKEVTLDIVQTLNSVSLTSVPGQNPNITTRYLKTNVSVPNKGTVVLGGLIKREVDRSASGVPLLSKLPVLGYLFRSTKKVNDREELVILIRPVVTKVPTEVLANSELEQQRLMIEPNLDSTLNNAGPAPSPCKSVPFRTQSK